IFATWVALAVYVTILGVLSCTRKRWDKEAKPVRSPYWGAVTFAMLVLIWVPYPTAMVVWTTGIETYSWVNISSSPNILLGGVMDRGFAENFAASVASASGRILPVNLVFSWDGFVAGVSKSAPLLGLKLLGVFGFYSHSDLCVPLTFLGPGISGYSQADTISSFILLSGVVLIIYSAAGTAVNVLLAGRRRKSTGKRLRKSKTLRFPLFFSAIEFFTWTPIAVAYCVNRYVPGAVSTHSFELLAVSSLAINCGILSVSVHVWGRVYYDFGSAATSSDDTSYGESSKILGRERKQSTTSQ
uniref:Uncharacterized protein n=1 Tax=Ciona savignyi TaxID=51511 RepID=H2YRV5_CIOSA